MILLHHYDWVCLWQYVTKRGVDFRLFVHRGSRFIVFRGSFDVFAYQFNVFGYSFWFLCLFVYLYLCCVCLGFTNIDVMCLLSVIVDDDEVINIDVFTIYLYVLWIQISNFDLDCYTVFFHLRLWFVFSVSGNYKLILSTTLVYTSN